MSLLFGQQSQKRLSGVDPRLVEVLNLTRQRTGIPFEVTEGMRDADRQKQLVAAGKSQTMNSRHLHGNATDIHIKNPDGSVNWDFEAYRPIADEAKKVAAELGYNDFVWGGDWKSLKDGVHFQIGGNTPQSVAADTMTALGQPPRQENEQMNLLGLSTQGQFRADPPQQKEPWWNADRRDRLVMGLEGMTLNPNQGLMAAAQAGLQERAQGRKDGAKEQQNTERRNRTAQWLAERGREDLAQAVAGGMIDAKTAVSEAMKPPAESYRQVTGDEARDMGLDPSKVYNVGGNGRISGIGGGDTNVNVGTEKMSPGWKKIDETFGADQYVPWVSGGGSDAIKQIGQLRGVVDRLQAGEPITGPAIGMQPDALQSIFSPGALDAKQRVQEVVQRNLRTILGAQFTEKEGKALIERAFDQRLQPEQNAARLSALVMQMESAAQSKTAMVEYFNENGTLQGFNGAGYIPSMADFEALFDRFDARDGLGKPAQGGDYPDAPQVGAVVDGYRFNGGNPADQSNWSEAQ